MILCEDEYLTLTQTSFLLINYKKDTPLNYQPPIFVDHLCEFIKITCNNNSLNLMSLKWLNRYFPDYTVPESCVNLCVSEIKVPILQYKLCQLTLGPKFIDIIESRKDMFEPPILFSIPIIFGKIKKIDYGGGIIFKFYEAAEDTEESDYEICDTEKKLADYVKYNYIIDSPY